MQSRQISLFIKAHWRDVYNFAANPHNLPQWASGLSENPPVQEGDEWFVESPQGRVKLFFAPDNNFGILDHWVVLPNGAEVYMPVRVIAAGKFSEVIFTLQRQPEMDDAKFEEDANMITKDLHQLAQLVENKK